MGFCILVLILPIPPMELVSLLLLLLILPSTMELSLIEDLDTELLILTTHIMDTLDTLDTPICIKLFKPFQLESSQFWLAPFCCNTNVWIINNTKTTSFVCLT